MPQQPDQDETVEVEGEFARSPYEYEPEEGEADEEVGVDDRPEAMLDLDPEAEEDLEDEPLPLLTMDEVAEIIQALSSDNGSDSDPANEEEQPVE